MLLLCALIRDSSCSGCAIYRRNHKHDMEGIPLNFVNLVVSIQLVVGYPVFVTGGCQLPSELTVLQGN